MQKIKLFFLIMILATFTACGGGSSTQEESISDKEEVENNSSISILTCEDGWTEVDDTSDISTGDETQLKFSHDSNGNKKVCVVTGFAMIKL